MKKSYIAKPNTWFKENQEVKFIEYLHLDNAGTKYGLFKGIHIINENDKQYLNEGYNINDEIYSTEVCSYEEFI
jgi:hypothetical protein